MKNRSMVLLAIIFGALTCYLIYDYLTGIEKKATNIELSKVVVTSADISAKTILSPEMLQIKELPEEYIHPLAFRKAEDAVGRVVTAQLAKGEQLLTTKTAKWGETKEGLSYIIPSGQRAMTVATDEISGVAGMLKPGDRVDVAAVLNIVDLQTQKEVPFSFVVLQNILVLAVGKNMDSAGQSDAKNITLAVTVEQSRPLLLASQKGAIRLMLRSPLDSGTVATQPIKPADILK